MNKAMEREIVGGREKSDEKRQRTTMAMTAGTSSSRAEYQIYSGRIRYNTMHR